MSDSVVSSANDIMREAPTLVSAWLQTETGFTAIYLDSVQVILQCSWLHIVGTVVSNSITCGYVCANNVLVVLNGSHSQVGNDLVVLAPDGACLVVGTGCSYGCYWHSLSSVS